MNTFDTSDAEFTRQSQFISSSVQKIYQNGAKRDYMTNNGNFHLLIDLIGLIFSLVDESDGESGWNGPRDTGNSTAIVSLGLLLFWRLFLMSGDYFSDIRSEPTLNS